MNDISKNIPMIAGKSRLWAEVVFICRHAKEGNDDSCARALRRVNVLMPIDTLCRLGLCHALSSQIRPLFGFAGADGVERRISRAAERRD
eukprot:6178601-Pleurochrysis_carterae.AAC.3